MKFKIHWKNQLIIITLTTMEEILFSVLETIHLNNEYNTTIYVSIGCATLRGKRDPITNIYKLDESLTQQYPPFLQQLKNENISVPIHIFLFDPLLEKIPYCVADITFTKLNDGWNQVNEHQYYNRDMNINVYVFRKTVFYEPFCNTNTQGYSTDKMINLSPFFNRLNELSMVNNWFTVACDFSGYDMKYVAFYYNSIISEHNDHIIYGLGICNEDTCSLKLTECIFVYKFTTTSGIKVYNPFKKINPLFDYLHSSDNPSDIAKCKIMNHQKNQYFTYKKKFLLMKFMNCIRMTKLLSKGEEIKINEYTFTDYYLIYMYNVDMHQFVQNKQYDTLFSILIDILINELTDYFQSHENPEQKSMKIVIDVLKEDNVYKWNDMLRIIL